MASGVPVILGEHFRASFADAALYCTPAEAPGLVKQLYADPDRYRAVVSKAREFAERRYGHQSHLARLAALGIGSKIAMPAPRREPVRRSTRPAGC